MSCFLDSHFFVESFQGGVKSMLSRVKAAYDCYAKPVLGEKGQDMVEYALMLAIVVGIGWLIYQQGELDEEISQIFSQSQLLIQTAAGYAG